VRTPAFVAADPELDPDGFALLVWSIRVHSLGLRRLLDQLIDAGLLVPAGPGPGAGWGSHTLALPDREPSPAPLADDPDEDALRPSNMDQAPETPA
jgi:hypothetical protein